MQIARHANGSDLEIAHAEEPAAVQKPAKFGNQQLLDHGIFQLSTGTIARVERDHLQVSRNVIELKGIESAGHGIERDQLLLASTAVDDLHLKQSKRKVQLCHAAQSSKGRVAEKARDPGRGKLQDRLLAGDIRFEAANSDHGLATGRLSIAF